MDSEDTRVLYARARFDEQEKKAVNEVLENPESLVGGEFTEQFEEKVAALFDKEYGVMVNSGSSANLLAIELLQLPSGSEVITPVTTFSTTVAPIVQNNLVPTFVDVNLGDYQIDVEQVENNITEKTRAMMIPSLIGNVPHLEKLRKIANKYNLYLIEDSADTLGATINGQPTGSFTDISTTSFYGSHIITGFGGGGMICVNDEEQMEQLKKLRGWGRSSAVDESEDIEKRFDTNVHGIQYDSKFIFDEVGYNFLPLEASAAFGLEQLKKLEQFVERRSQNFEELYDFFTEYTEFFILPQERDDVETNWLGFPLTVSSEAPFKRIELVKYLEQNNIQTRSLWSGNILNHPGFENIDYKVLSDGYPNGNRIMESSFVIGCHQSMDEKQLNYLKDIFQKFFSKYQ